MEQSRYHRVILKCVEVGYDQGFSDAKESLSEGVHTCHDQCQRIACVQRREIDELKRKLEVAKKALVDYAESENWFHISPPNFAISSSLVALRKYSDK